MRNSTATHTEDSGVRQIHAIQKREPRPRRMPGIVTQIRTAFRSRNRLAAVSGMLMGGIVPLMTYFVAHFELAKWFTAQGALVCGGLLFSAITIWQWARAGFACPWKATGFAIIVEGVMVVSQQPWLAQVSLGYLIVINGIATGVRFSQQR